MTVFVLEGGILFHVVLYVEHHPDGAGQLLRDIHIRAREEVFRIPLRPIDFFPRPCFQGAVGILCFPHALTPPPLFPGGPEEHPLTS